MDPHRVTPIDYRTPPPVVRKPLTSIGLTIYAVFVSLIFYGVVGVIIPKFAVTLADFKTTISPISLAVIQGSRWLGEFPGITLFFVVPIVLPMLLVRFIHAGSPDQLRWRRRLAYSSISLFAAVAALIAILAVVIPWVNLLDSVSQHR